jgi:hypothetical protein
VCTLGRRYRRRCGGCPRMASERPALQSERAALSPSVFFCFAKAIFCSRKLFFLFANDFFRETYFITTSSKTHQNFDEVALMKRWRRGNFYQKMMNSSKLHQNFIFFVLAGNAEN